MKNLLWILALLSTNTCGVVGFSPSIRTRLSTVRKMSGKSGKEEDPTKVWYASIANGLQNLLTNSPLNEGKKALVRSLAGDYDQIAAKAILDNMGVDYTTIELDIVEDGKAIRAEMADIIGRTSVPAIWIGGQFIGGCNDGPEEFGGITALAENGKLNQMLQSAGLM